MGCQSELGGFDVVRGKAQGAEGESGRQGTCCGSGVRVLKGTDVGWGCLTARRRCNSLAYALAA